MYYFITILSFFLSGTVKDSLLTMTALSEISSVCDYVIATDADIGADGEIEAFLRGLAPMKDVLHLQGR